MNKRIAFFENYGDACIAVNQLRNLNVNVFDVNESSHASLAGADTFYYVETPSAEVEKAKRALMEMGYEQHIIYST